MSVIVTAGLLAGGQSHADSTEASCGYSGHPTKQPEQTVDCRFSQRQGYITISFAGEAQHTLSPVGDLPGNFLDAQGRPVYRQRGPGIDGQMFKLPDRYLFVLWSRPLPTACTQEQIASPRQCHVGMGGISFHIFSQGAGSLGQLTIRPEGLAVDNTAVELETDGQAYAADVADLDNNGWPEVYIYTRSAGSGSYGSVIAYAVNRGKSISPVYLPPLDQSPGAATGYMGHDRFHVRDNRLLREFPIYGKGDTNAAPDGGTRQLLYRLQPGEAAWQLKPDEVIDY